MVKLIEQILKVFTDNNLFDEGHREKAMKRNVLLIPLIIFFIVCKTACSEELVSKETNSLFYERGVAYAAQGKYLEAEEEFKKDKAIGKFILRSKYALKVIDDLNKGIINKEEVYYFFKGLDCVYGSQKSSGKEATQEAINYLQKAVELKPDFIWPNSELALYYAALGDRQRAMRYCQRVVELNSRDSLAFYNVGIAYFILKEPQKSIDYLKKAAEIDPDCVEVYAMLGTIHQAMRNFSEAIKSFQTIQQIDLNNPFSYVGLGRVYVVLGQYEKALEEFNKAKELYQNAGDSDWIQKINKAISTVSALKSIKKKYPRNVMPKDKAVRWMWRMIFFGGILFLLAIAVGLFVLAYILLPKNIRVRTCPAERFIYTKKILIPLSRGDSITVKPGSPIFSELISNFTDEVNPSSNYLNSDKLYLEIKNRRYALEVSLDGWNFKGEEPNCRQLRNPMQIMQAIYSLKEEYYKTKNNSQEKRKEKNKGSV